MEFKDVPGYEDIFQISRNGDIYSKRTNKVLKTHIGKRGYRMIATKIGGRKGVCKTLKMHRLVALTYIPNPENKEHVNHIDGDKLNNNASNLEWNTPRENIQHAERTGLSKHPKLTKSKLSALSDCQVCAIKKVYKPRCRKFGARALSKKYNVCHVTILKHFAGSGPYPTISPRQTTRFSPSSLSIYSNTLFSASRLPWMSDIMIIFMA